MLRRSTREDHRRRPAFSATLPWWPREYIPCGQMCDERHTWAAAVLARSGILGRDAAAVGSAQPAGRLVRVPVSTAAVSAGRGACGWRTCRGRVRPPSRGASPAAPLKTPITIEIMLRGRSQEQAFEHGGADRVASIDPSHLCVPFRDRCPSAAAIDRGASTVRQPRERRWLRVGTHCSYPTTIPQALRLLGASQTINPTGRSSSPTPRL
jgi:hypothetical protein